MARIIVRLMILALFALIVSVQAVDPLAQTTQNDQPLDILILHGKLVDGSGKKPRDADVGIRGDRIVFIGNAGKANLTALRIIDAAGMIVAPGFIDPHTHTLGDLSDANRKSNQPYLMQGVTTVVTGNDGDSAVNIAATLRRWDQQGIGTNAILLAGFGTIRSESAGLLAAIDETIRIGREAKIPVHISHFKALGPEVWHRSDKAIKLINKARASGIAASACQYPYIASGTNLQASLLPRWAEVGGRSELLKRIDDPGVRPRLLADMEQLLKGRGGAGSLLIADSPNPEVVGKRLDAIAASMNRTPVEAALELIKLGRSTVISFNMHEEDVRRLMKQKFVLTCSDGSAAHPRKYGTFPRKLREYVFRNKFISLAFAVRNSSALTAETFRISNRGLAREGYFADVIIFDPKAVSDRATYEQPELLSIGMRYVIVNGRFAVENSAYTGVLAGRALRKGVQ